MKSVFAIALVVLAGLQAEARSMRLNDTTDLKEGSFAITSVAGTLVGTSPLCPVGMTCITGGTIVDLSFTTGCLDQFLPVAYVVVGDEVIVHAQVVANKNSLVALCNRVPTYPVRLQLINTYAPLQIRFMNTNQVIEL